MFYKTEARSKILEFLSSLPENSFTAEELCAALSPAGIGRSTVFRQLSRLTEEALIKRLTDSRTRAVSYQYLAREDCHSHLHLKCKSCGKLIHLDRELSELFEEKILSKEHFSVDTSCFLAGICESCKES